MSLQILHLFTICLLAEVSGATQMHNIYWNATNHFFESTEPVIEVNAGNHPWEYDQVNLVCPVYKPGSNPKLHETYIVYSVSKHEYDTCRITQANPRVVAVCNQPHNLMYFTITFRSFTPTPGGLEFRPGQDYYFISTSSKSDLHRRVGGGCSSHNMKIVFRVAAEDENKQQQNSVTSDDQPIKSNVIPPSQEQLDRLRQLIKRRRLMKQKHLQDMKAKSQKNVDRHHVGGGPHPVLYYPWREMIRGKTGYSGPNPQQQHQQSSQGLRSSAPSIHNKVEWNANDVSLSLTPVIALISILFKSLL